MYVSNLVMFDQRMYLGNGIVKRWADKITASIEMHAIEKCPVRTGEMKASISGDAMTIGERQIDCTISVGTEYATFVLNGTGFPGKGREGMIYSAKRWAMGGPAADPYEHLFKDASSKWNKAGTGKRAKSAVPKKGFFMRLPAEYGFKGGWYSQVHGQDPNNFLAKAARAASRNHKALRGFSFPEIPD